MGGVDYWYLITSDCYLWGADLDSNANINDDSSANVLSITQSIFEFELTDNLLTIKDKDLVHVIIQTDNNAYIPERIEKQYKETVKENNRIINSEKRIKEIKKNRNNMNTKSNIVFANSKTNTNDDSNDTYNDSNNNTDDDINTDNDIADTTSNSDTTSDDDSHDDSPDIPQPTDDSVTLFTHLKISVWSPSPQFAKSVNKY